MYQQSVERISIALQIFMAQEEGKEEDRISLLPDCLLIEIISRLDLTKEAIKTSTLSKRWQHLWTQVPNLILIHQNFTHSTTKFFSIVDKTLSQCCRQSTLTRFVLEVDYDVKFESLLNSWIRYAINRKVQEIDLSLCGVRVKASFVLDQLIFINSCFTRLDFDRCRLSPTSAVNWKSLKSLCISCGKLDENLIQNILSGSPLLETFKLCNCYGFKQLDITSKSVKNLVFSGYWDRESNNREHVIEISAPYISSLSIRGTLVLRKLLLLNMTSLVEANLNFWKGVGMYSQEEGMLRSFVLNLRHVKELKIGRSCQEILSRLEAKGFTFPLNVKFTFASKSELS